MNTERLPRVIRKVLEFRRRWRFNFIISKVNIMNRMKVCDVGCCTNGRSFEDFAPSNWEIVGVDILPPDKIRHSHPNFKYLRRDALSLAIK